MHLNDILIKNLHPRDKMYRKVDGDGLSLEIHPNGGKYWRMFYRFNGKRKGVAFGTYPTVTLKAAREKRLEARRQLDKGIDPSEAKKQKKLDIAISYENNFEAIAREWHHQRIHTWQPKHAATIMTRLATYVFPKIGSKPITQIKAQELLHAISPIEKQGKHEMAHRMMQTSGQIFRYAVACGKADRDITQDLKNALSPVKSKNYARLKDGQLPEFLEKLNKYDTQYNGNPIIKWGFQLLILTFVRSGEMRGAKWDEMDFENAQWRIPASRMKMKEQHIVPLSKQSVKLFRKIQEITGDSYSGYVFPSFSNHRKTISENTFLKAIEIMGYKNKTTAHGFRATASTLLNENGYRPDVIERQLAHAERDQIRAAYNHAQYLTERIEMMQWWADYLENIGLKI
jgi:integrase